MIQADKPLPSYYSDSWLVPHPLFSPLCTSFPTISLLLEKKEDTTGRGQDTQTTRDGHTSSENLIVHTSDLHQSHRHLPRPNRGQSPHWTGHMSYNWKGKECKLICHLSTQIVMYPQGWKGWWFDPRRLQSACQMSLGKILTPCCSLMHPSACGCWTERAKKKV